jgi:ferrous iron transport protein A
MQSRRIPLVTAALALLALSQIEPGETAVIERLALPASEEQLLMRFGFFVGAEVKCSRRAPLGDPIVYSVDGSEIALRAETACRIYVSYADPARTSECQQ